MKLKDKIVLVTGAASGLGRATALACARQGAALFMVDRHREGLEITRGRVQEIGATAESFVRDLVDRQACFDAVAMAVEFIKQPIRINALAPGSMDTEMNVNLLSQGGIPDGLDRSLIERYSGFRPFADPAGMANMIVHMLSDETPALHGSIVSVDAGMTAG